MKRLWKRPPILIPSLLLVLAGMLLSGSVHAAPPAGSSDPVAAATAGLSSLKSMATQAGYASFGFQSAAEVSKAKLGGPISTYMIEYDELKALAPTADPKTALHDLKERIFPVFVGGAARAAITVRQQADGTWQVVSMGNAQTVKLLEGAKAAHGKSTGKKHEYMLITIPALYQMFLAHTDGAGKLHFVTMVKDKALGSTGSGQARPARTVLDLLTKLAKDSKPLAKPAP